MNQPTTQDNWKRFEPFLNVIDHEDMFPIYVSFLEKIGDIIWEGYGGTDGTSDRVQKLINERVEFMTDNWHFIEPTILDVFKTLLGHIEKVEYEGEM